MNKKEDSNLPEEIVNFSADIAGGTIGAIVSGLIGGLPGAAIGSATGSTISYSFKKVGTEIKGRLLGPREDKRIASTIYFAAEKIDEKLQNGEEVRADGFFDAGTDGRSSADEVLEGTLIAAQREHEERKLKYIGNLLANIGFEQKINKAQANLFVKTAESLSYRQFQILSFLLRLNEFDQ